MDESVIDRWIASLGSGSDSVRATEKLEELGEPALKRLFEVSEGLVQVPFGPDLIKASHNRALTLGRLGKRYPELFLELVNGREFLKMETIQALGSTGDERLRAIARAALKNFGNDR